MGTMAYAERIVTFDDRTLTHLQIVILRKFRRGEAFAMSWVDGDLPEQGGRVAMWLTPVRPVLFKFDRSRVPAIDQGWIDRLARSADSSRGLVVTDAAGRLVGAASRAA